MAKRRRTIRFVLRGMDWSENPDMVGWVDRREGAFGSVEINGLDTVERMYAGRNRITY